MRTKRAIFNFLTDFFPLVIITIIGLLKLNLINANLGLELSGLNSTYVQIMTYLSIMDGGLASALIYRLYKPLADQDNKKISSLAAGAKRIFSIIGVMMFALGIVVSFFVFYFIKMQPDSTITYRYVQLTFILYLISSVIPYFVVVSRSLFEAGQRKYVVNMVTQSFMIFKSIVEIFLLMNGKGLVEMYLLLTFCNLLSSGILYLLSKKAFPEVDMNQSDKDFEMLGDVKSLLIHKIGTLVAYNIDVVLISSILGVVVVPIYTAYQYITDNLMTMIGKLSYSVTAGIGDLLARDKKRAFEVFNEFNSLSFFIATVICIPLVLVINQFITLWMKGMIQTTLGLAIFFVLQLFYYIIRMPLTAYTNAAGLFKETRLCPIIECVVNLCLSLLLIHQFGIVGILAGTFIAYLVSDYFIKPVIIHHKLFDEKVTSYYLRNCFFVVVMIALTLVGMLLIQYLPFSSYLSWFLSSLLLFAINGVLAMSIYIISKQALFLQRVKDIAVRKGWIKS